MGKKYQEKIGKGLSRREFLNLSALGLGSIILGTTALQSLSCSPKSAVPAVGKSEPNILIMVADDAGWHDVKYHGSRIKTPVIDKLKNESVELNRFYVCPTCSPTRASLLTGRFPSRFGILGPIGGKSTQSLPMDIMNLPKLLHTRGYTTALTGKWHLGLTLATGPNHYGFDYTYGYLHGQIDQYTHFYKFGERTWQRNGKFIDEPGHATDLISNEAVKYITKIRDKSKPFFLEVTFSVPHTPVEEPQNWVDLYKDTIKNPSKRRYAAAVSHMDYAIGNILHALKKENIEDNTIVMFFSDNGSPEKWNAPPDQYNGTFAPNDVLGSNLPLRDWKASVYEGAIRVPAMIRWPGKLEPKKLNKVISVADILPTLAYVTGANTTSDMKLDGVNVWKTIKTGENTPDRIIYERTKRQLALIDRDFKIVHNGKKPGKGTNELYNLEKDPDEKKNIAKEHPDMVNRLLAEIKEEAQSDVIVSTPDPDKE